MQPPEGSYQPHQQFAQPPQPYPYQPAPSYPYPPVQQVNVSVNVNSQRQHSFLLRALYFIFIGSWLGYFWLCIGFALCAIIITLPLGLSMLNRIPQVMTLKASNANAVQTNVSITSAQGYTAVNVQVNSGIRQANFLTRALYYCFIGCWLGFCWANLAYFLCLMIVTLPLGIAMFNKLPAVLTLRKG